MKIAVVGTRGFPGIQGGVEKHCEELYPKLVQLGCKVIVFTRKPYISYHEEKFRGITLIPVGCPRNKYFEALFHTFLCVFKAWKLNPDLLHIHAVGPSLFAPLARILGLKVVVTNHGPDYQRRKWSLPAKIFLRFCEWTGAKFACEIISLADNIALDIKKKYARESFVIPNGVVIPQTVESEEILVKYNLQKRKYILAVGRLVPEKGFHDLIKSFEGITAPGTNGAEALYGWKLVIAGAADHRDKYSIVLKEQNENVGNIIFTGFLTGTPLHELYGHAGLFVLPSYHEGLPIVLLEAMSYGLSCIASDIPANRNIPLEEDRFFNAGDVNSLMKKIRKFIDKSWADEDREKSVALIERNYNWDNIAEKTLMVYEKVLKAT